MKSHAARARNKRGSSVDFARILFLFEHEREGYKRFTDCTVNGYIGSVRRGFVVNLQLFLKASVCVDGIYLDRIGVDSCGEYWKLCCICTSQVKGT